MCIYIYVCVCLSDPQDMFFDWKTPASLNRHRSPGFVMALKAIRAIRMEPLAAMEGEAQFDPI